MQVTIRCRKRLLTWQRSWKTFYVSIYNKLVKSIYCLWLRRGFSAFVGGMVLLKRYWFLSVALICILPAKSYAEPEDELWKKLKNGGMVILMRHAPVNRGKGQGDSLLRDPSCVKERNLSEEGKNEAANIGEIFAKKGIPIERVMTSPYCRTVDTAKLAFNR
ncbi:MAG: hypothetical protein EP297_06210, partial [Gammaproteobacteria bacterium]